MPNRPPVHRSTPRKRPPDRRPSASARGYGTNWRRLRLLVLQQRPMCEWPGCCRQATDVDHKDGNVRNMTMANLAALCKAHHSSKTVKANWGFGRAPREKQS
jgi:5-methylcytosine-specific restriction enzyme A